MRLKLDENLGRVVQQVFADAGYNVETVVGERLSGADDDVVFDACRREGRCLVTLDLDFADPVRFRPGACGGIVVLRLPHRSPPTLLKALAKETVAGLKRMSLDSGLWIVEPGRIRVHQSEDD